MLDNNIINDFNNDFPKDISDQFLFPFETYELFLKR